MTRRIRSLLFLCLFPCLALSAVPARAASEFVIGVPCMNAQCSFPEIEAVMREVYARAGLSVRFEGLPMLRDLVDANSGAIDGTLGRTSSVFISYPHLVMVPVPLIKFSIAALTTDPSVRIESMRDLAGRKVGCLRGATMAVELGAQAAEMVLRNTYAELFRMLAKGRIDAVLTPTLIGLHAAEAAQVPVRASAPLLTGYYYHAVNERHAHLVDRLAETLRSVQEDGTSRRLFGQYLSLHPD